MLKDSQHQPLNDAELYALLRYGPQLDEVEKAVGVAHPAAAASIKMQRDAGFLYAGEREATTQPVTWQRVQEAFIALAQAYRATGKMEYSQLLMVALATLPLPEPVVSSPQLHRPDQQPRR